MASRYSVLRPGVPGADAQMQGRSPDEVEDVVARAPPVGSVSELCFRNKPTLTPPVQPARRKHPLSGRSILRRWWRRCMRWRTSLPGPRLDFTCIWRLTVSFDLTEFEITTNSKKPAGVSVECDCVLIPRKIDRRRISGAALWSTHFHIDLLTSLFSS